MSAQHTPGPWVIRMEGREKQEINVRSSVQVPDEFDGGTYEPLIADLYRGGTGNIHDARLIAAAPDLLEALRGMLEVFGDEFGIGNSDTCDAARAAIAKATGGFGMTTQPTPMELKVGRATGLLQAVRSIAAITTCADQDPEAMCAEIQGICRVALAKVTGGAA